MEPIPGRYRLLATGPGPADEGPCLLTVEADAAVIGPTGGAPVLRIPFRELARVELGDQVQTFVLEGGERIELSRLARRFDEARRAVLDARREFLLTALLALEPGAASTEAGRFQRSGAWAAGEGACRVRLQRTSLAVLPDGERPFVVPYGELLRTSFDEGTYALRLELDGDRVLTLAQLGKRTDALRRELERLLGELAARAARAVGALVPAAGALALRRLSAVLRDGVPASRAEVDAASPGAWDAVVARCFAAGLRRDCAAHLAARASAAFLCIKEVARAGEAPAGDADDAEAGGGAEPSSVAPPEAAADPAGAPAPAPGRPPEATLPPELEGRHVAFLFAVDGAVVLEIPSVLDAATYVFRAGGDAATRARELTRGLAAIQFRREPISASDADLAAGRLARYAEAAALVPELRALRRAYAGRAVHASLETWRKRVDEAIAGAGRP